jgi:hypothetical protein
VLAEIAAANAAFSVIKTALSNGKELFDVGEQAVSYFDNKSALAKKANANGNKSELAAFMELQKLKKQEEWLKDHMIYAGDPGMWDAWLKFQSDCKRNRERERQIALQKKMENRRFLLWWAKIVGGVAICIPIMVFLLVTLLR